MRIGIDIDDTLTKTTEIILKYAEMFNSEYDYKLVDNMKASLKGKIIEKKYIDFYRKYIVQMSMEVELKEHSKEIIDKLLSEGHEIFFITAREDNFYKDAYKVTYDYLKKNNVNYTKLITGNVNKGITCKLEKIDVFFDDLYKNVIDVDNVNIKVVLYNSVNNMDINSSVDRINSWIELYEYVNKLNDKF